MPCATTWVQDTAVQLVRKLKEERESSKEEAAAVAQALAKVKARNQEVGAELAASLAKKAAAEQEVSNAEHRLQSTRESMLRLEQQEAVAAVSLAHKDSQISLLQQCQNFVEHQAQLVQNQKDETTKYQQEVLKARQDVSSARLAASKVKLEAENLHQALDAAKVSRDKHAEEVEQLRRTLDDVKTLCGKHAADAKHLRSRLSEVEATRDKFIKQVSEHENKHLEACRKHSSTVRNECDAEQRRVEGDSETNVSQTAHKKETMAATSTVKETKPVDTVEGPMAVNADAGREAVAFGAPTDVNNACQPAEQRDPRADESGHLRSPNGLETGGPHQETGEASHTKTPRSWQTTPRSQAAGVFDRQETGKQHRETDGLRVCANVQEERRPDRDQHCKQSQIPAGPIQASATACPVTAASSTSVVGSKSAAPDAERPEHSAQQGVGSAPAERDWSKVTVVPRLDVSQTPRPWRPTALCPPTKYQRISGPAEFLANSCQECGLKKHTFLDANDNMHYCQDCWVAFYGGLPKSSAGAPHGTKHPAAADHAGARGHQRCKPGGRFKCPKCPTTFTLAKDVRRHLDNGRCKGGPK
eukprot:TRINITY_DN4374_c0_g1_i1.p1 TRINITY_DN4374_c0_g1~~TRINITY_DN4374_c0_g1_i1.p1  ORF type:complete len:609 (+),score=127.91 TRINITY_DN4374_c0_g1_i1:67-1827(+)